jgi:hypothetical protein
LHLLVRNATSSAGKTASVASSADGIEMGRVTSQSSVTIAPAYAKFSGIIEGPYGTPSVNFNDPEYQVVLLIAGGIGATPLLSLYHDSGGRTGSHGQKLSQSQDRLECQRPRHGRLYR